MNKKNRQFDIDWEFFNQLPLTETDGQPGIFDALGIEYDHKKKLSCINPKHDDKNPSMTVSSKNGGENNVCRCWSCGYYGTALNVVQDYFGYNNLAEAAIWIENNYEKGGIIYHDGPSYNKFVLLPTISKEVANKIGIKRNIFSATTSIKYPSSRTKEGYIIEKKETLFDAEDRDEWVSQLVDIVIDKCKECYDKKTETLKDMQQNYLPLLNLSSEEKQDFLDKACDKALEDIDDVMILKSDLELWKKSFNEMQKRITYDIIPANEEFFDTLSKNSKGTYVFIMNADKSKNIFTDCSIELCKKNPLLANKITEIYKKFTPDQLNGHGIEIKIHDNLRFFPIFINADEKQELYSFDRKDFQIAFKNIENLLIKENLPFENPVLIQENPKQNERSNSLEVSVNYPEERI